MQIHFFNNVGLWIWFRYREKERERETLLLQHRTSLRTIMLQFCCALNFPRVCEAFKENPATSRYLRLLNKVLNIFHELCLDKYYYRRCNKGPGFIVYFHPTSTRGFFQEITSDFPFAFSNGQISDLHRIKGRLMKVRRR